MRSSQRFTAFATASLMALLSAASAPAAQPTSAKLAALKDLRDTGVLTPEQYAARLAELRGTQARPGIQGSQRASSGFGGARRTQLLNDTQLGLTISRVTLPADWRFHGGAGHGGGCSTPPHTISYAAESPDGAYGVYAEAGFQYGFTNVQQMNAQLQRGGCLVFSSPRAADFLRSVWAPQMRPGAQVQSVGPLAGDDPIARLAQEGLAKAGAARSQIRLDGGQLRLSYVKDGRPMEELVKVVTLCSQTQQPNGFGGAMQSLQCTAAPIMITRAPAGRLDAFAAEAPRVVTVVDDPAYAANMQQIIAQQGATEARQIAANGEATLAAGRADNANRLNQIIANKDASIANIQNIGGASRAAARSSANALHESAQATARAMGDQAQFRTPDGRSFDASNQFSHTYVDSRGRYMQTDSAYPPGPDWTEVQGR